MHERREPQVLGRPDRRDEKPAGTQRRVQGIQAALVGGLRKVGEDREREGEIEWAGKRQPLGVRLAAGEPRGHAAITTDVEDRLGGIAAVEPAGIHVARHEPRQPAPSAAEVEDV